MRDKLIGISNNPDSKYKINFGQYDSSAFENKIRTEVLNDYYDAELLDERFKIPDDYLSYISYVLSFEQACDSSPWGVIYGGESCISSTKSMFKYHFCQKGSLRIIMVCIGYWSDKHEYWLSCDKENSFGKIFDSYDMMLEDLNERSAECVFENLEFLINDPF